MGVMGVLKTEKGQRHRTVLLMEIEAVQLSALLIHMEANAKWNPWKRYKLRQKANELEQTSRTMLADYNSIYRSK